MGSHCTKGSSKKKSSKHTTFVPKDGFYQPSREETGEAYQALLSILEHQLGGRSHEVMCVVADEVLSILKSVMNPVNKKMEIEKLLNPMEYETFNQLVEIAEVISDYHHVVPPAEPGFYQPRCEDTWAAYRLLLKLIVPKLDARMLIKQCREAHSILLVLKDEKLSVEEQRKIIENCLGTISQEKFDLLVFYGGLLWDFDDFKDDSGHCGGGDHVRIAVVKENVICKDDSIGRSFSSQEEDDWSENGWVSDHELLDGR